MHESQISYHCAPFVSEFYTYCDKKWPRIRDITSNTRPIRMIRSEGENAGVAHTKSTDICDFGWFYVEKMGKNDISRTNDDETCERKMKMK